MNRKPIKILICVAIALVMFSPTVAAIISYTRVSNQPEPLPTDKYTVALFLSSGEEVAIDAEDTVRICEMFLSLRNSARKTPEILPEGLTGFSVRLTELGVSSSTGDYRFAADGTAYTVIAGEAYRLDRDIAGRFLSTKYACSMYADSTAAILTFSGQTVRPREASWKYTGYNGISIANQPETVDEVRRYNHSGNPTLEFSTVPDSCTVRVLRDEREIYNGTFGGVFSAVDMKSTLTYEIHAEWENRGYADYSFTTAAGAEADFFIEGGQTAYTAGSFAVISSLHVTYPDDIVIEVTPALPVEAFEDGEYVRIMVPFPLDTAAGSYKVRLVYGETDESFVFKITEREYRHKDFTDTASAALYNTATVAEYDSILNGMGAKNEKQVYYLKGTTFIPYDSVERGMTVSPGFAFERTLPDGTVFTQDGVQYRYGAGYDTGIYAANSGKVVRTGNASLLGKYIVVDHGLGVKSWYCHLGDLSVKTGDTVSRGTYIGTVGKSGLADVTGLYYITTVCGVPVSPYEMQENGIKLTYNGAVG